MTININDLTIGQMKELASLTKCSGAAESQRLAADGDIAIAILQRGHVAIGIYSQNGLIGKLDKASIIRRWGTSEGLGELAMKGPLPETKLDACPPLTFHIRETIALMGVTKSSWEGYFSNY